MSAPGATSFRQPFVRGASGQHAPRAQGRDRAIVGHIGHTVSWWWLAVDASYPRPCLMGAGVAHLEAFGALGPRRRAELEGVVAQRDDVRQCARGVRLVRRARGPREVDLAPDERLHLRQLALQLAGSRSVHSLGSSRRATASSALRLPTLTAPPPTAPAPIPAHASQSPPSPDAGLDSHKRDAQPPCSRSDRRPRWRAWPSY